MRMLLAGMLLTLPVAAWAQGNESTSASTPGSVIAGVLVGAGTTDETTTGSSGPRKKQEAQPADTRPIQGTGCARVRDETAKAMCEKGRH